MGFHIKKRAKLIMKSGKKRNNVRNENCQNQKKCNV